MSPWPRPGYSFRPKADVAEKRLIKNVHFPGEKSVIDSAHRLWDGARTTWMGFRPRANPLHWYRGHIPPGEVTPLQLLMIQSTSFCNIDCSYCYLSQRSVKSRFDLDRLPHLVERLSSAGLLGPRVTIAWHAGEPLALPPAYYARADEVLKACAPPGTVFCHNFQTNATLVNDAWCDLFDRIGATVGVSIDGPEDINDARRVTRDGKGTFARTPGGVPAVTSHRPPDPGHRRADRPVAGSPG